MNLNLLATTASTEKKHVIKKWSKQEVDTLMRLRREGFTYQEIAAQMNRTLISCYNRACRVHGIDIEPRRGPRGPGRPRKISPPPVNEEPSPPPQGLDSDGPIREIVAFLQDRDFEASEKRFLERIALYEDHLKRMNNLSRVGDREKQEAKLKYLSWQSAYEWLKGEQTLSGIRKKIREEYM